MPTQKCGILLITIKSKFSYESSLMPGPKKGSLANFWRKKFGQLGKNSAFVKLSFHSKNYKIYINTAYLDN
jgi:hypothetical protein